MVGPAPNLLRVLAFPVKNRAWAFHASVPAVAEGTTAGDLTVKGLWQSLKLAPGAQERAVLVDEWGTQKARTKWAALEKARPTSFKGRIARWGNALMNQAHSGEIFLKSIPRDTTEVDVHFPQGLNPRLVRRRVRLLARRGNEYHRCWTYVTAAALPFSSLLSILPLPNLVLFYNLYRAHANWHAWKGGDTLMKALAHPDPDARATDGDDARGSGAARNPTDSEPLRAATTSAGVSGPMSPETLSEPVSPPHSVPERNASSPVVESDEPGGESRVKTELSRLEKAMSDPPVITDKGSSKDGTDGSDASITSEAAEVVSSLRFGRVVFRPSRKLADVAQVVVDSKGIPLQRTLGDEGLAQLIRKYDLEEPLLRKWRDTGT